MTDVDLTAVPGASAASTGLHGYLAQPDGTGPWPGVVVVHEAWGLNDVMRRSTDRMARAGYLTLAPDLFSDGGAARCLVSTMRASLTGKGRAYQDLEAARRYLVEHPDCTGQVGVLGFCMGGGFALMSAGTGFQASSVNYGHPPKDLEATLRGACPIVGSYGGRDRSLRGAAAKLTAALERLDIPHDVKEYPRAGHSFLNDAESGPKALRPVMRAMIGAEPEPESAADAWRRIEAFFGEHLAGRP